LVKPTGDGGDPWKAVHGIHASAGYTGGDSTCCGGQYYQHHNPFVYFPSVTSLPDFNSTMVPSTNIVSDLSSSTPPDFVWLTPNGPTTCRRANNLDRDSNPSVEMRGWGTSSLRCRNPLVHPGRQHHRRVGRGDRLRHLGPGHVHGGRWPHRHLDISAALKADPQQDSTPVSTAGVLHSIEGAYGLPYLADAADASNGTIDSMLDRNRSDDTSTTAPSPTTVPATTPLTSTPSPTTTRPRTVHLVTLGHHDAYDVRDLYDAHVADDDATEGNGGTSTTTTKVAAASADFSVSSGGDQARRTTHQWYRRRRALWRSPALGLASGLWASSAVALSSWGSL